MAKPPINLSPRPSGGVRRHCRGRRAGRHVQERRKRAIEHERRLDRSRVLIPLTGSVGPAHAGRDPTAEPRVGPGLPADSSRQEGVGASEPHRVGRHPAPEVKVRSKLVLELLNIQSLLPKLPDIRTELLHRHPDMLCYTETNLKNRTPDRLINLPGYLILREDRIIGRKKSGGGVAIFVRENYHADKLIINRRPSTSSNVEILWAKVKLDNRRAIIVGCIYRPPTTSTSQVNNDFDDIEEQLQTVISAHSSLRIILAGDLNADAHTNPTAHQRLVQLQKYGLNNLVNEPTFYRGSTVSVLDVVLVSDQLCEGPNPPECSVDICDFTAHHRRVTITTVVPRVKAQPTYRTGRAWRSMDREEFLTDVGAVEWRIIVKRDDSCEQQWNSFISEMNRIIDRHAPTRRYRVHNPSPPVISADTQNLIRQRREARKNKDETYRRLNAQVKRAIRKDMRESIAERVASAPASTLYRQLQPVIAPKRGPPPRPEGLTPDQLNSYFASVGIETRDEVIDQFKVSNREQLGVRLTRVHTGNMNIVPISLDQLKRTLFSMQNKDSKVEDDIPVHIFKLCFEIIGKTLLQIVNTSLVTETVPSSWKRAIVIPIYKKGDPSKASNFRPVTTVPTICKLVERLVHDQLISYLRHYHLFSTDQHGFIENHSTCTALISITDEILRGMDRSEITFLTLIDLSRCFDVIDHGMLLKKLQQLHISTGWIQSYLEGHTQRVKIDQMLSMSQNISIGTFQGSCLGPLLFNIFTNDFSCFIPTHMNGFRVTLVRYADDAQIAITGPRSRLSDMQLSLESVLDIACTWFMQHGMKVNADKTEMLLCGDTRQLLHVDPPTIAFMGETLRCSETVRNLGVVMDPPLSYKCHIDRLVNKCIGILIGILNVKHALPRPLLPRIIDALVFSHVRYCVQVYGSTSQINISKLQKIFNFAARVISGRRKYDHISSVLNELGWLSAKQFVTYFDICLLHDIMITGRPYELNSLLVYNRERATRATRQSDQLSLPRAKTNHGKRLYMYRAVQKYNQQVISKGLSRVSRQTMRKKVRDSIKKTER